jgi:hypothetical protein
MKKYTFRLKHDAGYHTVKTIARTLDAAVQTVCIVENCPEIAIVGVWITPMNKKGTKQWQQEQS